jgi:hypothetical protein
MEATTEFMFPAGDYLIIDPCYVYDGARWEALSRAVFREEGGVKTDPVTGCHFAFSFTATGDGVYADQDGYQYSVDSGSLACLPLAMVDAVTLAMLPVHDHSKDGTCSGRMVTFTTTWVCVPCDEDGVIRFGPVEIQTHDGHWLVTEGDADC